MRIGQWLAECIVRKQHLPPVDDAPRGEYASKRSAILRALDAAWQRYLESIQWLENWISLTGIAGDPYRAFVETADRMFRDMRREFAVAAAKLFFAPAS